MKVTLISTTETNIGDDLIRRGVQRMIAPSLPDADYRIVNKHHPWTLYVGASPAGELVRRLSRGQRRAMRALGRAHRMIGARTPFTDADLVVQCGTPVMWHGVRNSEWQWPIWEEALGRPGRPPVLNVSGGSCYPWTGRRPTLLEPGDDTALRFMFDRSDVFTARDREAARVAESLGTEAHVFPCAAMHAGGGEAASGDAQTLIVNVMPRGGHFDWGQGLDPNRWLTAVDEVITRRARTDRILFLCHSADELDLANSRWPEHQAVLPRSTEEYLDVARRGRIALVNRMHAAVALAGLGVPAVAIGTDTRLLMVQETGQEICYLADASAGHLLAVLDVLDAEFEGRRKALLTLEEQAFSAHRSLLAGELGRLLR